MQYTEDVRFETRGLLSPRSASAEFPKLESIEILRFLAAMHIVFFNYFPGKHDHSFVLKSTKNFKSWGFTAPVFFVLLSGFVLTYRYAPKIDMNRKFGFSVPYFFFKRLSWLYPVYLISLLLPVWTDPLVYFGTTRKGLKFLATAFGASGFWVPAHRTYHVNDGAWMASTFLFLYLIIFPLFLKPIHTTLSRTSKVWLVVFVWPWTWFFGWVVERLDETTGDDGVHWDWNNPIFYVPSFLMGMIAGSIFVQKDPSDEFSLLLAPVERFGGLILFAANCFIFIFADPKPLENWHRTGSLSLIQVAMIYLFATGKDLFAMTLSLFPFRMVGGTGFCIYMLHHAVHHFASQIDYKLEVVYFVALAVTVLLARFFVQIPYARWLLKTFQKMGDQGNALVSGVEGSKINPDDDGADQAQVDAQ